MTDNDVLVRLRQLSAERQRELLARRRSVRAQRDATPVSAASGPVSYAQQRLHFMQSLLPDSPLYNISGAVHLTGEVDLERFEAALRQLATRQECLRTRFVMTDGQLSQEVRPDPTLDIVAEDLTGAPSAEVMPRWSEIVRRRALAPFDLAAVPLWRVTVGVTGPQDYEVLATLHHLIADDWSMRIFFEELITLYARGPAEAAMRLGAPTRYIDWVARTGAADQDIDRHARLDYWRELLGTGAPPLDIATSLPRPEVQVGNGALWTGQLDAATSGGMRELARSKRTTLFATLLAAWAALLARQGTADRLVVGVPVANRDTVDLERTVGLFVDTLPVVVDVDQDLSLGRLTREAGSAFGAALSNNAPLEQIIQVAQPPRLRDRSPLFQTMLTLHNVPRSTMQLPGVTITTALAKPEHTTAMYDISLDVVDDDELQLAVEYDTDLFTEERIAELGREFKTLCRQLVERPELRLRDVDLSVQPPEAPAFDPVTRCIHDVVLDAARRQPGRDAVVCGEQRLDYHELASRVERLAALLTTHGVGPERPVAVVMSRRVDLIVAMLGVMAAGGIYVPLDPLLPRDRLAGLITAADPILVLTDTEQFGNLVGGVSTHVLTHSGIPEGAGQELARPVVHPANAAYMIFTSGSTGTPKGVVVPHTGLVSLARWYAEYYRTAENTRHLGTANHAFDAFLGDVGRSLLAGGTLVLATREEILEPAALHRLIEAEQIECMETVPAVMRMLGPWLRAHDAQLTSLKYLIVGSDTWYADEISEYRELLSPGVPVVAAYGVTEATVDSTYYDGGEAGLHPHAMVPIGHAVSNSVVYLLDSQLRPVPPGVVGELFIGGQGLARGYAGQPALTAERFVPDPFGAPGERLYVTGDLGRWCNGEIEFLGRKDRQVKIRGFRVEPDEVERVLLAHSGVREAAVVVRQQGTPEAHLAAYVVLHETGASGQQVLDHARRRLPAYLVPSSCTVLPELPRTTSNKIDRSALPATAELDMPDAAETAWTDRQWQLRAVWSDVLGVEINNPSTSIFDLGGHSLLIPQLIHGMEQRLGLRVPLAAIFEYPSIAALDEHLAGRDGDSRSPQGAAEILRDAMGVPTEIAPPRHGPPERVLVTGATGYLGAHVVQSLCDHTSADVLCLVRADDIGGAEERLRRALATYRLDPPASRIRVIPGDIEQFRLGLADTSYRAAVGADTIIHTAARVNLTYPYRSLREPNVTGTHEVIRLAAESGARLHHVSTAGVAGIEAAGLDSSGSGYTQSKWVAEQAVQRAFAAGLTGAIHRPDYIGGSTVTGVCNESDLVWAMVRGSIDLGAWPSVRFPVPMAPVDMIAEALVAMVTRPAQNEIYGLSHPAPPALGDLFGMVEESGYQIEPVPGAQWLARLEAGLAAGKATVLLPFVEFLRLVLASDDPNEDGPPPTGHPNGYVAAGVDCPAFDQRLMSRYLESLTESGFLPSPTGKES